MDYERAGERARALVSKMTVEEKASQLLYNSPAIERLGYMNTTGGMKARMAWQDAAQQLSFRIR